MALVGHLDILYRHVSQHGDALTLCLGTVLTRLALSVWLRLDRSIALANFVGRFEVYHSMQGASGQWNLAGKSQLANDLGSEDKDACIQVVLKEGGKQQGDRFMKDLNKGKYNSTK